MSHRKPPDPPDNGGNDDTSSRLIRKAIAYARHTHQLRSSMRELLAKTARVANPYLPPDDPATPPLLFVEELRRPKGSKRRAIHVIVDGHELPIILNPQGEVNFEREKWLWNYVRGVVGDGAE